MLETHDNALVGIALSGEEAFRVNVSDDTSARDLKEQISDIVGVSIEAVSLLEGDDVIKDAITVEMLQFPIAVLDYAIDIKQQFHKEWRRRRDIVDCKRQKFYDLCRQSDAAKSKIRTLYREDIIAQRKKYRLMVSAENAHLRGFVQRRKEQADLSRKADMAQHRARSKLKSAQRLSRIATKYFRECQASADARRKPKNTSKSKTSTKRCDGRPMCWDLDAV